jgi:hypothetical protein
MRIAAKRLTISRKLIVTVVVVLVGVAIGITFAVAGTSTTLLSQSISFTSTPPASPVIGDTYRVAAVGGASGNRVTLAIDSRSASI